VTGAHAYDLVATTPRDHAELHAAFATIVAKDEGYPQFPDRPLTREDFEAYWLRPASIGYVARNRADGALAGAYTMKPNGVGRAGHVANAGYFVCEGHRGKRLGERLVLHSFDVARAHGFDAMQYNFVFADNPARHLYERLGFRVVGEVPEVIDGKPVYIYWRKL